MIDNGLALQLFQERGGKPFVKAQPVRWPFLHSLLQKKQLPYIDYAVAEKLLSSDADESVAALLCHLSLATREGHLCIAIDTSTIVPSPEMLWRAYDGKEGPGELEKEDLKHIRQLILAGMHALPDRIVKHGNRLYFPKQWNAQTLFLTHFDRLRNSTPVWEVDVEKHDTLLPEQNRAILNCAAHVLSILCGGPGTGKTFTAGRLIEVMAAAGGDKFKIAVAAPTGKAAANLSRAMKGVKAQTLHTLLGKELHGDMLDADLVLVDESSMIDIEMMARLFQAIKPGARLLLLGDPHQLPSVEAGSVFADIVDGGFPFITQLNHCMRTDLQSILHLAEAVNAGNEARAAALIGSHELDSQDEVIKYGVARYPKCNGDDPIALMKAFSQFRILSPLRQGPFGVDKLNKLFINEIWVNNEIFYAPIMICTNNADLELFNGEVGLLVRKSAPFDPFKEGDYALFMGQEKVRKIPAILLPRFEYAYCMSVHKSQGSEFDELLLLWPKGAELFGREGLYTGITRAKKLLAIWGDPHIMSATIRSHSRRESGIIDHIRSTP